MDGSALDDPRARQALEDAAERYRDRYDKVVEGADIVM